MPPIWLTSSLGARAICSSSLTFFPPSTHLSLSVFGYSEIVMQGLEIKNSPTELSVKAMPSLSLSLCLCMPHLSTCVHVCEGPRPMSGAVLQLRLGLLLQWDSSSRLGCVSREPQGSFRLHFPRAGIIGAYHQACFSLYAGDGIQALTPMWQAPD